jgi:hypothetical protein
MKTLSLEHRRKLSEIAKKQGRTPPFKYDNSTNKGWETRRQNV